MVLSYPEYFEAVERDEGQWWMHLIVEVNVPFLSTCLFDMLALVLDKTLKVKEKSLHIWVRLSETAAPKTHPPSLPTCC